MEEDPETREILRNSNSKKGMAKKLLAPPVVKTAAAKKEILTSGKKATPDYNINDLWVIF